jgi:putative transposase
VREAAAKLGISVTHLYRLIRLFREDRRVSVLLPRRAGRPVGKRFISESVEAIIQAAVREVYLVPDRPTFRELVRQVAARCRSRGEQPPDARTIRRRVDDIDPLERARLRMDEAAQEALKATPGKLQVERPFDLVQIDHTQMDIVVVDEETRQFVTRPC